MHVDGIFLLLEVFYPAEKLVITRIFVGQHTISRTQCLRLFGALNRQALCKSCVLHFLFLLAIFQFFFLILVKAGMVTFFALLSGTFLLIFPVHSEQISANVTWTSPVLSKLYSSSCFHLSQPFFKAYSHSSKSFDIHTSNFDFSCIPYLLYRGISPQVLT